ncbi:CRISPR-associated endonuclease/helicase Cas3 [mine drainage metagenome]|uniref:CRISPR-associated endonuclease/helicase Cas3 n=1 Tax=mine drainage metagenome TaxID=410659 RepID=A0A1J5RKT9_9ZZZZ
MNYITRYWGKAGAVRAGEAEWHPAAYHCLDVAAVMEALLRTRPHWRAAMARTTALPEDDLEARLLISAALHDIGKFAENFQHKVPELAARAGHVPKDSDAGHGTVGWAFLKKYAVPLGLEGMADWLFASVSHHGTPVDVLKTLSNAMSPAAEVEALRFAEKMISLFGRPGQAALPRHTGELWRVAGLTILADWVGSNRDWFPYREPDMCLEDYWSVTRAAAALALDKTGLREAPAAPEVCLATLLGAGAHSSPLQAWAERQTPVNGPHLYLVEDLTGAGKTEAALILAHRLMRAGAAEGLYWALPTMATANGLYRRLHTVYHRLFRHDAGCRPSLVLAHSARDLNDDFQLSIENGPGDGFSRLNEQDVCAEANCAAFIAEDRKKTFLAQVGIGTLDQALLGALPVRHQALRLAALSRRVLIIDEAHAYDDYMSKGLEHLLKFQKALGGSSIVLSATLTQAQKRRFAAAYGADANALAATGFPLTTQVYNGSVQEETHASVRGTRRDLPCRQFDHPDHAVEALLGQARLGRCGVYIRNSVREALETYRALKSRWDKTLLFHARFCLGDRLARETDILNRFGKEGTADDRAGWIVIATQVVEQSLDLDFDVMASDLCPMDLLIQRAGRLQRHERSARPDPVLWVVAPPLEGDIQENWYGALFKSGQYVYPDAGQLWRTLRVLKTMGGLVLASASPRALIEPVFGDNPGDGPPALEKIGLKAQAKRDAARGMAHLNFLTIKDFTPQKDAWSRDVQTPTRLGDPTITLRLATWRDGHLEPWAGEGARGWRLSEISVRSALCEAPLPPDAAAAQAITETRARWQYPDPPSILAVCPTEQADVWQGRWRDPRGNVIEIRYSARNGLWRL